MPRGSFINADKAKGFFNGNSSFRIEAEEAFEDNDVFNEGGGDGIGVNVPEVQTQTITWKYGLIPQDKYELEQKIIEDEAEGISVQHNYKCELCRVGTLSTDSSSLVSLELQKVYNIYHNDYGHVTNNTLYESIARKFNETIYERNSRLGKKKQELKKWTKAMVRHHFEICDRSNLERELDKDIHFCNILMDTIRTSCLYKTKFENNEEKESDIDKINFDKIQRLLLTKERLVKTKSSLKTTTKTKIDIRHMAPIQRGFPKKGNNMP
jgi:hypothetical protein